MKTIALFFSMALLWNSCKLMPKKEMKEKPGVHSDTVKKFYDLLGADSVFEYTLTNKKGMQVKILNYGGTVTHLFVPDKNGKPGDVVLGYDSLSGYLQSGNPYFGCLVGRYANRIAKARFKLGGQFYFLPGNDQGNTLHGGRFGFDKVIWQEKSHTDSTLILTYLSRDGEEGFPGNLSVDVQYTVGNDQSLRIDYTAITDRATPVNLTSHCYFNLSGGSDSTILNHELMLLANHFTPVNEQLIPTGIIASVKGTPMDFTTPKKIGKEIGKVPGGYDHNWVLKKSGNDLEKAGSLYHSGSGRFMEIFTTEPGIQFYSGNFLDGTLKNTKEGKRYIRHAALCLEAQHFPDSPNQPAFPNTILMPGETYRQTTVYRFSVK